MKTTQYITVVLLAFSMTSLFAGELSKSTSVPATDKNMLSDIRFLAPVTPSTATFDEVITVFHPVSLIPDTPKFADFDDFLPEPAAEANANLAPAIPGEATFDDDPSTVDESPEFLQNVAPSVPQESTFEDMR